MPLLSEADQKEIKRHFEKLSGDVNLIYFTQRESPLFTPGQECATCQDTRQLLDEVCNLSEQVHLETHDFFAESDVVREHKIDKIPALVMTGESVKGRIRYFGMPAGYEFSVLLGDMLDVSQGTSSLADEARESLVKLESDIHIQVFVTPT